MQEGSQEIWLSHYAINPWRDVSGWASYLSEVEGILDTKLTRLDIHDPIKRKVTTLSEAGEYICDFGEKEESRWLFAKFDNREIDFAIHHHKEPRHLRGQFPNSLKWNICQKYLSVKGNENRLKTLFRWGNQYLSTFFAYGDIKEHLVGKKNKLRGKGAISLQAELPGISWLNYFNDTYVNFFGREKFNAFPEVIVEKYGGITICLGETPFDVAGHLREEMAVVLGRESFVNPADIVNKPIGKYALSYEQLRNAQGQSSVQQTQLANLQTK